MSKNWQKQNMPTLVIADTVRITGKRLALEMPWERCLSLGLGRYLGILSGSVNTSKECVLFSILPSIASMVGPTTRVNIDGMKWFEPLNVGSIILGTAGSGKSPAYNLAVG